MFSKNKLKQLSTFLALGMMEEALYGESTILSQQIEETEEQKKKRLERKEIEQYKAKGLTEFFYGENSVWALNQKTADKKAKKKGYL